MCAQRIRTSEANPLRLFLYAPDPLPHHDARRRETLSVDIGWITDEACTWELWYESGAHRIDKIEGNYPRRWSHLVYRPPQEGRKHRKRNVNLECVSPLLISAVFPRYTRAEAGLVRTLNTHRGELSIKQERLKRKIENWQHGVRTVDGIGLPRCRINDRPNTGDASVQIEPTSTALVLLRIIEQRMMHIPKKEIRGLELEGYDRFVKYIAALDPGGFAEAASICSGRYVAALSLSLPEPSRSDSWCEFIATASEAGPEPRGVCRSDPVDIERALVSASDDHLISIDQIQIVLLSKRSPGARSPRRIRDKLRRLGVEIMRHPILGDAISIGEYQKHSEDLLRHGNHRSRA